MVILHDHRRSSSTACQAGVMDAERARTVQDDQEAGAFDLGSFLPWRLNPTAEAVGRSFQSVYRTPYAMTRTQWRGLANRGRFGAMTAADIGRLSHLETTKVPRAVAALEERGLPACREDDRRNENLSLTPDRIALFEELGRMALDCDRQLRKRLGPGKGAALGRVLGSLIERQASEDRDGSDDPAKA